MKTDLDLLMQQHEIEALLVTGNGQHNPAMVYLTGGAHMTPELVKRRGSPPILYCYPIERDEAAGTGLETRSLSNYPIEELLSSSDGDYTKAIALRTKRILEDAGINTGKVAVYGHAEVGVSFAILSCLQDLMPQVDFLGETRDTLLEKAMLTKDAQEIERIHRVGQISTEVLDETMDFLSSHRARNGVLVTREDHPLTIGEVKNKINLWLVERGLENPHGSIFSIGHDAGVPHSSGKADDLLRLGQSIVFDLYPSERGGGYFHDMTRTWCLGYAPDEFMSFYEDVSEVLNQICQSLSVGTHCTTYQEMAFDLFEKMGHSTIRKDPKTETGFVHGLGHGVGLKIHERPWFGKTATAGDLLTPGVVFTIEPGLYDPGRNLGVRLENTYWVDPTGKISSFVSYPFSPVLNIKN